MQTSGEAAHAAKQTDPEKVREALARMAQVKAAVKKM